MQNAKAIGSNPELRRTSSFDRTWEENVAESVANELVLQMHSSTKGSSMSGLEQPDETSKSKLKETKLVKPGRSSHEEKKTAKVQDDKKSQPRKLREFHNIKISQVGSVLLELFRIHFPDIIICIEIHLCFIMSRLSY